MTHDGSVGLADFAKLAGLEDAVGELAQSERMLGEFVERDPFDEALVLGDGEIDAPVDFRIADGGPGIFAARQR
jgi:hypothetical protein